MRLVKPVALLLVLCLSVSIIAAKKKKEEKEEDDGLRMKAATFTGLELRGCTRGHWDL